ncbi:hypothetical protein DNU06_09955 [Putridiphycobacter roseus]|uniref:Uncharacterized protein n=1 Tax=Putridiphycobacter roseus TaxID=2219161 RepID=A0A2W1MY14_9FLAO|nr:hypothetical protein [Putridiphycobacter roseus]PZE17059.1 hypothetical protein DNU06_09955 [Putridiphycobacter roseus]
MLKNSLTRNIIIISQILLLVSCDNQKIKDKVSLDCSINEKFIRTCIENGEVIDSVKLIENKMEGLRKSINKEDSTVVYSNYSAGILNGPMKSFYFNGTRCETGTYKNNEKSKDWYQWTPSGNINRYDYFVQGKRAFLITYFDSIKVSGNPILEVQFKLYEDSLETYVFIANPNHTNQRIMVGEITEKETAINVKVSKILQGNSIFRDKRKLNKNNKLKLYYELKDERFDRVFEFKEEYDYEKIKSFIERERCSSSQPIK